MAFDARAQIIRLPNVGDGAIVPEFVRLVTDQHIDARPAQLGAGLHLRPAITGHNEAATGPFMRSTIRTPFVSPSGTNMRSAKASSMPEPWTEIRGGLADRDRLRSTHRARRATLSRP